MVKLREIPRTATFAWSPGTLSPLLATGTRAGAVDADFSNDTQLELWDLDFGGSSQGLELQPKATIDTDSRFHDIAWMQTKDGQTRGCIAGALENGSLDLWNADKLLDGDGDSLISRTNKHSGAIKSLQFNPFRSELLATAGAKGELFISDINNIENPFRLGNAAARADDFECLDWNKKVPHILATGGNGGFVTVWDIKAKKQSVVLTHLGKKPAGAVAWDPLNPTRLATAVPLDSDPLVIIWDLRNAAAPERIIRGHEGGVLSLSWCKQDSDLLLSCGKDNKTICWNPHTGESYGEFPIVTNWTFQTRWNPHNPNMLATASFDGKIAVQTIQSTSSENDQASGQHNQALDGADFFDKAQLQPQSASFSLQKAPKWLARPCGATFGFGGKVVTFKPGDSGTSSVRLSTFAVDSEVEDMTKSFEKAMGLGDLGKFCAFKITQATLESEKNDWKVIETLVSGNSRKELVQYLGISEVDESATEPLNANGEVKRESLDKNDRASAANNNRLSSFFDSSNESDNFLADLAATKGTKTNNPFHLYSGSDSDADLKITQALMMGQFSAAMETCLREDRMSDAFMIALCGGQQCIDKVQKAYFTKQASGPNYLRLLASVVGKNLWDLVYNADLENWKEVMATLCTYADPSEFNDLCEALGDRLEETYGHDSSDGELRINATFCYIAGSKLEKVVKLWIDELRSKEGSELEESTQGSSFSIHAKILQNFIEKVTVFRKVTKYEDTERKTTADWKLAPLYDIYTEYADIIASHGQLQTAEKYLDLLPERYPAADVARNRVKQATKKVPAKPVQQPMNQNSLPSRATPVRAPMGGIPSGLTFEDQRMPSVKPPTSTRNMYAPTTSLQDSHSTEGPSAYTSNYQPNTPMQQQPRQPYGAPPQPAFGSQQQNDGIGPPPRTFNASPAMPPPPKAQTGSWNDIPDNFIKPSTSRRGTPGLNQTTINPSFSNQPTISSPPMSQQSFIQQRQTPPPPPKGPAPPPKSSGPPPSNGPAGYQNLERPTSSSSNAYTPQPTLNQPIQNQMYPQVPRGASPYNPPPSNQPPAGRYAPAPAASQPAPIASPRMPPPSNPYAPQQNYGQRQASFSNPPQTPSQAMPPPGPPQSRGPPVTLSGPPQGPPQRPPQGPAQSDRPGTADSQRPTAKAAPPKHASGDRSHIPENALPIYEYLHQDMQRVKSKAPAAYKAQVNDAEKRLNILFDHLNNESLLQPSTISDMVELANSIRTRDYERAQTIHIDLLSNRTEECTTWMVGVKRLISMSRATP